MISGKVISTEKEVVDFATVYLKGTGHGGITNQEGIYHVSAPRETIRWWCRLSAINRRETGDAAQEATGEAEHNNQSRNPAVGRSDGSVDGGKPPQAFGVQCCGSDTKELQNTTRT